MACAFFPALRTRRRGCGRWRAGAKLRASKSTPAVAFSSDARLILLECSSSSDWSASSNELRLWETASGREIACFTNYPSAIGFSPDGRHIVTGSGNKVQLCDAASGRQIACFEAHTGAVRAVALPPDGLSSSPAPTTPHCGFGSWLARRSDVGNMTAVVFSPDGRYIVSSCEGGSGT
jgi:WD40 repeat protein